MDDGQVVGSWREIGAHLSTAVVLAGGVLVGAVNIYVAASLLPTAVRDIGGGLLYAWTTTAFLVAQVVATMCVGRLLSRRGSVGSYVIGFGVFAAGSVVCAVSPAMAVLLVGRGIQGVGAGLLTGLGFAVIRSALPPRLWARGSALVSAMFGVGNFVGPAVGGVFAQFGSWRLAFVVLAGAAVVLAVFVPRALPRGGRDGRATSVPVVALGLVVGAVAAVSVAGIVGNVVATAGCIVVGLALVVAFVVTEKRAAVGVLPGATYRPGSALRWVYLTIVFLASGVAVETFLPLFSQRLGGLAPVAAGFYAAALSFGWSASQIVSSSARRERTVRLLQLAGPVVLAAGFAVLAVLPHEDASPGAVLAWLPVLVLGGTGIGIAMPHLSVAAMSSTTDPEQGQQAAAAIATVLTMATAFGAAVAGLLVNLGAPSMVTSARYLLAGFAVIAACGIVTARRACRRPQQAAATTVPEFPMPRAAGCPLDPAPELTRQAERTPVARVRLWDGSTPWLVTRYADVRALLTDPRVSVDATRRNFPHTNAVSAARDTTMTTLMQLDPPEHTAQRRVLAPEFTVRKMAALRPRIQHLVDTLVDGMLAGPKPVDLVQAFALALPSQVICELLGVPYADRDFFHGVARTLVMDRPDPGPALAASAELNAYLEDLVAAKNTAPGEDLLSTLAVEQFRTGAMTAHDIAVLGQLLLVAGHDTTASMITLGTVALLANPDQLRAVREDPTLADNAVEELLRYLSITHTESRRVAREDLEVGGRLIRAGEGIIAVKSTANRDPAAFPDPDALDVHRRARHHVAFGYGRHLCLGAPLARVELQVVYRTLYRRVPTLALAIPREQLAFNENAVFYTVRKLPVTW